jgi:hypothetical protein
MSKNPNEKCIILMPATTNVEWETEYALMQVAQRGYAFNRMFGCANVDIARAVLASDALDRGFEEIFWIDSDIAFRIEDFERLREHDLPIVCGLYPKKISEGGLAAILTEDTEKLIFGEVGGLMEIKWAGTGFLYTKRCVYEDIKTKLKLPKCGIGNPGPGYPFFMPFILPPNNGDGIHLYLGDDTSFCERARQCGYKIYADTTIRLHHIGKYKYSWEDIAGERERFSTVPCAINRVPANGK